MERLKKVCKNCCDFDEKLSACTVRYSVKPDKSKIPMQRKPNQSGCPVFLSNVTHKTF